MRKYCLIDWEESWRPAVGYEDSYEVSDFGRVKSLDRIVRHSDGKMCFLRGRVLVPVINVRHGYASVCLCHGKRERINRMVLMAFVGPPQGKLDACHKDGIRDNNWLDNLEWGTRSKNLLDRRKHGTVRNQHRMIPESTQDKIRRLCKKGVTQLEVGKRFGFAQSVISHIVTYKYWPRATKAV